MPLGDIARGIGAAKSSTSNLCQVLEDGRMIVRTPTGYLLGRRTVELGGAYIAQFNQMREFYDFCDAAPLLGHEVVQIAMLDGTDVLYLARHEGRAPMRLSASIGSRFPAAPTAVGNALLTTLTDAEIAGPVHRAAALPATHRAQRADPRRRCSARSGGPRSAATPSTTTRCTRASTAWRWCCRRGRAETSRWPSGASLMAVEATDEFVASIVEELNAGGRPAVQPAVPSYPSAASRPSD